VKLAKRGSRVKKATSSVDSKEELALLREEVSFVTDSILKLVKKRQDLARKIAKVKAKRGLPIEDAFVEKTLKEDVKKQASRLGLDSKIALELLEILLDASKTVQRKELYEGRISSFLRSNKIWTVSVIGSGRMGGWFAGYFKSFGINVILFDKRKNVAKKLARTLHCSFSDSINLLIEKSDLIVVAVPISKTREQIENLQKVFEKKEGQVRCKAIVEVSSIKTAVLQAGFEHLRVPLISIHPLFGASSQYYGKNTVAMIKLGGSPERDRYAVYFAKHLFPQFEVLAVGAEKHDEQMALKLTLPHSLALAFADVIARNAGGWIREKKGITTSSYNTMREFAMKVLSENPAIYFEISSSNKFAPKVLRELQMSISELSKALEHASMGDYLSLWERNRRSLGF